MNLATIALFLLLPLGAAGASIAPPGASIASPQHKAKRPSKHQAKRTGKPVAKRGQKPAPEPQTMEPKVPPVMGSHITVVTKDGKRVSGQVTDFTALAIQVKSDSGPSTVPVDSVASISFGSGAAPSGDPAAQASRHPNFTREVESVLNSFQEMEKAIEAGADYTDYGRQLTGLRRTVEKFSTKYATSEDGTEARSAALLGAALTDYTWARTVWTLKLGRSAASSVTGSDSPVIADALDLYPDLRPAAGATGVAPDKLIGALWKKAVGNVDMVHTLISK